MSDLYLLQQYFMSSLVHKADRIKNELVGSKKVSVDTRLGIYQNAYTYRLVDVLVDNFPALHTLLGDEGFYELAETYLKHYPSRHFSVRWFGHQLAHFLEEQEAYQELPALAEMVNFEWALRHGLDAASDDRLSLAHLQTIPAENWADYPFKIHDSVKSLSLHWNVVELWQAIEAEAPPQALQQHERPQAWRTWRKPDQLIYFQSMPEDEAWALGCLLNQGSFSDLCEGLCEWIETDDVAERAMGLMQLWISEEILIDNRGVSEMIGHLY